MWTFRLTASGPSDCHSNQEDESIKPADTAEITQIRKINEYILIILSRRDNLFLDRVKTFTENLMRIPLFFIRFKYF